MSQPQAPPQLRIMQLILGFANTSVIYALVKTGVIEQMHQQPKTLSELADACHLNNDVLHRVLRFATVIGVVAQNEDQYSLTETGTLLLKDVRGSFQGFILHGGSEPIQRSWQNLAYSLTTGDSAFEQVMGDGFMNYINQHPEHATPFHQLMSRNTTMAARAITEAYDFSDFNTVCDIGGGQGVLLQSILTANPHLTGILFDQKNVLKNNVLADMSDRVQILDGNFFESVPMADVLMLKNVVHGWNDEKCQPILAQCKKVMKPSSRLLIIENVMTSPADLMTAMMDLQMKVVMDTGRERTEEEFSTLLLKAGLRLNRIIPTKSPLKIIEASL